MEDLGLPFTPTQRCTHSLLSLCPLISWHTAGTTQTHPDTAIQGPRRTHEKTPPLWGAFRGGAGGSRFLLQNRQRQEGKPHAGAFQLTHY